MLPATQRELLVATLSLVHVSIFNIYWSGPGRTPRHKKEEEHRGQHDTSYTGSEVRGSAQ